MKKSKRKTDVSWQNKDITSKIMAETFKGKSFSVYGLSLPGIVDAKPTNLPAIEANELRLDNLFLLEDGSYAIVDYESVYREENKIKYVGYIARLVKRIYNEHKEFKKLRIIIIYTADVKRGSTKPSLDLGGVKLELDEAFLSDFRPKQLWTELQSEANQGSWSDEALMKLIIYPLSYRGNDLKIKAVVKAIDLAEKITDKARKIFALTGIYVFSDKFIQNEEAERIRRILSMTKVEQIYVRERIEAVNKAVYETQKKNEEKNRKEKEESALNFLRNGVSAETISSCLHIPMEKMEILKRQLL